MSIMSPSIIVPRRAPIITPNATSDIVQNPGGSFGLVGFQTWAEIGGILFGAKPDLRGPIGGHEGYTEIVTTGDYVESTFSAIQGALNTATPGETVFVPGNVSVDCTSAPLEVPAGVTLASDRGHNGSDGALLHIDAYGTKWAVEALGDDVRVTGFRIRGHLDFMEPGLDNAIYGSSRGIYIPNGKNLEVDNNELWSFIQGGAFFRDRDSDGHYAHHNYCHHIWSKDQGYGFVMDQCGGLFEYNLFDRCRHLCAHTGRNPESNPENLGSGEYTARHNVGPLNPDRGVEWDMHSSPEDGGSLGSNNGGMCGVLKLINNYQHTDRSLTGSVNSFGQHRGTPYKAGGEYSYNWIASDSSIWDITDIFLLYQELYNCTTLGTCPTYNENLWDGDGKTVRGPGT